MFSHSMFCNNDESEIGSLHKEFMLIAENQCVMLSAIKCHRESLQLPLVLSVMCSQQQSA